MSLNEKNQIHTSNGLKVLSLFDGMACGMLALMGAGYEVGRYVAYEVNKYAIQTSTHNFPKIEHRGDVFQGNFTEFNNFDLLMGGSPCTYWSVAQKNNRETEASGMGWELFSQYVRALHEAKPKYFIYENNKSMSNAIRESITETFGFEPICINSSLVSAQNRQRLYWVGKRELDGTYSKVDVEQPEDRGILLKDILQYNTDREKSRAIIGSIGRTTTREYFKKHQGQMSIEPIGTTKDGKGFCLTARYYKGFGQNPSKILEKHQDSGAIEPVCVVQRGRYNENGNVEQHYEPREDNKTNVITTVQKDNMVAEPCEWDEDGRPTKAISSADGKTYTVYEVKNGIITIKGKEYPIKLSDGFYIIRKLTVRECMRLQTVPEWYEFPVSDTQAYKMLGNGWTVEVIKHLFESLPIN